MLLCSCGFANPDDAVLCRACGTLLSTLSQDLSTSALRASAQDGAGASSPYVILSERSESKDLASNTHHLSLVNLRTNEVIPILSPGVIGRAGDFAPDSFSPRVSGVHAVMALNNEGRWTIEHTGRNETSVERAGAWTKLCTGCPVPLFGGETLKLADMLFRVMVEEADEADGRSAQEQSDVRGLTENRWSIRCPVCGTEHIVTSADERIPQCTFCQDPLDARQIARVAPRAVPAA